MTAGSPVPSRSVASRSSALRREALAGVSLAFVTLPGVVSAGFLALAPLGPEFAGRGAAAGIYGAVFAGTAAALLDRSSVMVTGPRATGGLVLAGLAGSLIQSAALAGSHHRVLLLVTAAIALAGVWQVLFGVLRLGRIMKFTPYPVIAGFVNGIALLILAQQLCIALDVPSLGHVGDVLAGRRPLAVGRLVFFAATALGVLALGWARPGLPGTVVALVLGVGAYHGLRALAPGLALGPMLGPLPLPFPPPFPPVGEIVRVAADLPAPLLTALVATSLTLAIMLTVESLLTFRVAEHLDGVVHSPVRGLVAQGAANVVAAATSGMIASGAPAQTQANYQAGGRSRASILVASGLLLAVATAGQDAMSRIPVVVLAGLLAAVAIEMVDRWSLGQLSRALRGGPPGTRRRVVESLAVVVLVMGVTASGAVVAGAAVGFLLACVIFIGHMARPAIRTRLGGDTVFSRRVRPLVHVELLRAHGHRCAVFELEGVLFFGNTEDLAREVRALPGTTDFVLLDCRRVNDIDSSAAATLRALARRIGARQAILAVSGLAPRLRSAVEEDHAGRASAAIVFFRDQDAALEWDEDRRLAAIAGHAGELGEVALERVELTHGFTRQEIEILAASLRPERHPRGSAVCREGDPGDRLWILTRGTVSVRLAAPGGEGSLRIATRAPGTVFGEMAILDQAPRSASVEADTDIECLALETAAFADLLKRHPAVGTKLLMNLARSLSQRLRLVSNELREREAG
ncbi:MAG TPA: SulP family inorganic anion transporter [Candidatus Binatia bacterium]|nr:SulP family inorganic anion transporter [Candidatus Binatia bacterium]